MNNNQTSTAAWSDHSRRRARSAAASVAATPRLWIVAGLLLAVLLLGGFYVVMQDAVARAHTHWAQATLVSVATDSCTTGRTGVRDGCTSASVNSAGFSTLSTGTARR